MYDTTICNTPLKLVLFHHCTYSWVTKSQTSWQRDFQGRNTRSSAREWDWYCLNERKWACWKAVLDTPPRILSHSSRLLSTPEDSWKTPEDSWFAPQYSLQTPQNSWVTPQDSWKTPQDSWQTPQNSWQTPQDSWQTPQDSWWTPQDSSILLSSYRLLKTSAALLADSLMFMRILNYKIFKLIQTNGCQPSINDIFIFIFTIGTLASLLHNNPLSIRN